MRIGLDNGSASSESYLQKVLSPAVFFDLLPLVGALALSCCSRTLDYLVSHFYVSWPQTVWPGKSKQNYLDTKFFFDYRNFNKSKWTMKTKFVKFEEPLHSELIAVQLGHQILFRVYDFLYHRFQIFNFKTNEFKVLLYQLSSVILHH